MHLLWATMHAGNLFLQGSRKLTGLVIPYTGGLSGSSFWKVPKSLSHNKYLRQVFIKVFLLIAWCTLWCEGVTIICSRKPIALYALCDTRTEQTIVSALPQLLLVQVRPEVLQVSIKSKKFLKKDEILCRNAQARLNSSLLWCTIWLFHRIFMWWAPAVYPIACKINYHKSNNISPYSGLYVVYGNMVCQPFITNNGNADSQYIFGNIGNPGA